jgi:hypothetical protein
MLKFHADGDKFHIEKIQDVEPILENNALMRSTPQKSDWGRQVASIPNVIYYKWFNEAYERGQTTIKMFGPEMDEIVERKLKDPEWAYLRTDSAIVQGFMGFGS